MVRLGLPVIFYLAVLAPGLEAEGPEFHLAVLGRFPEPKILETLAARHAVDGFNALAKGRARAKLLGFDTQGTAEGALAAAGRIATDKAALAVLILGEDGVQPGVLDALEAAGLGLVSASSWMSPRRPGGAVTWLSPSQSSLASMAADYARQGKKASQAAVLDNGSPTSAAAARAFSARFKELGGRVDFEGEWQGTSWGLTRTLKALQANWPQVIFFSGEGAEAGKLVKAMKATRELKEAQVLGLPSLMDPGFFREGRVSARLSTALFPAPDYRGTAQFSRSVGLLFPRSSPNYKAYVGYAYRKPGRWTSMAFDGAKLLLDAVAKAMEAGPGLPLRMEVRDALRSVPSYQGIRGEVEFSADREPKAPKAMVYYALPRVNSKDMIWYDKDFGPPFR